MQPGSPYFGVFGELLRRYRIRSSENYRTSLESSPRPMVMDKYNSVSARLSSIQGSGDQGPGGMAGFGWTSSGRLLGRVVAGPGGCWAGFCWTGFCWTGFWARWWRFCLQRRSILAFWRSFQVGYAIWWSAARDPIQRTEAFAQRIDRFKQMHGDDAVVVFRFQTERQCGADHRYQSLSPRRDGRQDGSDSIPQVRMDWASVSAKSQFKTSPTKSNGER